jgi:acetaldehyde dehydrogenase/alcohol dehydrogenase
MSTLSVLAPGADRVDVLMARALVALDAFTAYTDDDVDHIIKHATASALHAGRRAAGPARPTTLVGPFVGRLFDIEDVPAFLADPSTRGVVVDITDADDPVAEAVWTSIATLRTRLPVVFAFPASAHAACVEVVGAMREAAVRAGAPEWCIQWLEAASPGALGALARHADVALVLESDTGIPD